MSEQRHFRIKLLLAAVPMLLALLVLLYPGLSERSIDNSVLILIVLAMLIVILPWEYVTTLKAAGVEITLDNPQLQNAVEVLKQRQNISDEKLRALLQRFEPEIEYARGSRILWIDNRPRNVLGERRLFRALGMEIVMAASSERAREYLCVDGDFDLIISDVRRGPLDLPEGVRFIKKLVEEDAQRRARANYSHIPAAPVIFYSSSPVVELLRLTQDLLASGATVLIARGVEQLLQESLRTLYHVRREPLEFVQDPEQTSKR